MSQTKMSEAVASAGTYEEPTNYAYKALGVLRIGFGVTFLWAFFDKLFALGFATGRSVNPETGAETVDRFGAAAWINEGNPTFGFLNFGAKGPFEDFYHSLAGDTWVNWAFMLGLLFIGLALTLGIGMRMATIAGVVMYVMMWTVALPPENHPFLDDHILGALTLIVLAGFHAGDHLGLGRVWKSTSIVQNTPVLR